MSASALDFRELTLDGQPFIVPCEAAWDGIVESGSWCGLPAFYPRTKPIVIEMLRFVREHAGDFSLGLCKHGPFAKAWTATILFEGAQTRRVHVERVQCERCGAVLVIANPAVAELFLGADARDEAFARASQAPRVPCAQCACELPRPAAWVELLSTEGTA